MNRFPVFIPALAPSSLAPRTPDTPSALPPDDYHPNTLILICNAPLLLVSLKQCVGGEATTNCSCRALRSPPCRHGSCLQLCCALTGLSLMLGGRCTMRDGRLNVLIVKPKKQVCCAPRLHQAAQRAHASWSQFSLFSPVMDTSAQIKQLQVLGGVSPCMLCKKVILMRAWCRREFCQSRAWRRRPRRCQVHCARRSRF